MAPKMTLTGKFKGIAEDPSAKHPAQGLAAWSNLNAWDSKILIWAEEMVESSVCVTVCRQGHLSGSSLDMCQNICISRYSKIKWFWIKIKKHPKYHSIQKIDWDKYGCSGFRAKRPTCKIASSGTRGPKTSLRAATQAWIRRIIRTDTVLKNPLE